MRLSEAIARVPAGAWGVGVSGGADSVALLALLRERGDLRLHAIHLDHGTRGQESADDARFVTELAAQWGIRYTFRRRSDVEPELRDRPANASALFRRLRIELFGQVVRNQQLAGVIVAHHANDQAETVFHRLLRGSGYEGLCGMSADARVGGVRILRPLLDVPGQALREHLTRIGQLWREDTSNQSNKYMRNRLRRVLATEPGLSESMLKLGSACRMLREWVKSSAARWPAEIRVGSVTTEPEFLAEESARRWLIDRGVPAGEVTPAAIARLLEMVSDAAAPARQDFPDGVRVCRRGGMIFADQR